MGEMGLGSHVGFSSVLRLNEVPTCVVIAAYSFCLFLATACCMDDADCLNFFLPVKQLRDERAAAQACSYAAIGRRTDCCGLVGAKRATAVTGSDRRGCETKARGGCAGAPR